jgi:hypothetical protein
MGSFGNHHRRQVVVASAVVAIAVAAVVVVFVVVVVVVAVVAVVVVVVSAIAVGVAVVVWVYTCNLRGRQPTSIENLRNSQKSPCTSTSQKSSSQLRGGSVADGTADC